MAKLRSLILDSVSDDDLKGVIATLIDRAKAGEQWAVRELLDRCIGKARPGAEAGAEDAWDGQITIVHVEQPLPTDRRQGTSDRGTVADQQAAASG